MCLVRTGGKVLVSKHDRVVYVARQVSCGMIASPFDLSRASNTIWKIGEVKTALNEGRNEEGEVKLSDLPPRDKFWGARVCDCRQHGGFHSFEHIKGLRLMLEESRWQGGSLRGFVALIPAGTRYVRGKTDMDDPCDGLNGFVSEKLVLLGEIK